MERDHYRVLLIPPNASFEEIKQSYRKLAMRYHPDRNQNNPHTHLRFYEIQEAYEVLSNPETRRQYDESQDNRLVEDPIEYARSLMHDLLSQCTKEY